MPPEIAVEPAAAETDASPSTQDGRDYKKLAGDWISALDTAEKADKDFVKRGRKITNRYRSEISQQNSSESAGAKFNLFWSNVQTLGPATYSRPPKVEVTRRWRDQDPIGRLAGLILERALQYEIDKRLSFHHTLQSVVLDRLLPGRGVAWVRYEPSFETQSLPVPAADGLSVEQKDFETLSDEFTPIDYVYWENFKTSPAQTWADVTWVARMVPFDKAALEKRFGESTQKFGGNVADVSIDYDPIAPGAVESEAAMKSDDIDPNLKRALVWEIWDKTTREAIFVSRGYEFPLDVVADPAGLDEFFPAPRPVLATTTNDRMVPVPDFIIYQEQLRELDSLTQRISLLTSALRVIGVYDASQDSLKDLLQSGLENRMVPVNAWAAFAEKGGLKGVTDFLPLEQVVVVLEGLYKAREACKQTVYEITGMADIIRGASVASETLGAQEIKAKFANLRLSSRQQQIAEFVTAALQIKAQIMCSRYAPETLIRISSAEQIPDVIEHPDRLPQAIQLLKSDKLRSYRIVVQAESMIELDELDEQKRRNEFMSTVSNFFLAAKNIAETGPEMMPVALEMLKFAVRGFPVGRSLESALEDAVEATQKRLKEPPTPPQPGPAELVKLEVAKLQEQGENGRAQLKSSTELEVERMRALQQAADEEAARRHEASMATAERTHQMLQQHLDAQAQAQEAERTRQDSLRKEALEHVSQRQEVDGQLAETLREISQSLQVLGKNDETLATALGRIFEELRKPRRRVPTYTKDGDILHVDESPLQ